MKLSSLRIALAVLVAGSCTALTVRAEADFATVSLSGSGGKPVPRSEYIVLVVEGSSLSFESTVIPESQVVTYVNQLLKERKVSYIGLYAREGTKYGQVIRMVDVLRGTTAKSIGLSISELPLGREP